VLIRIFEKNKEEKVFIFIIFNTTRSGKMTEKFKEMEDLREEEIKIDDNTL
jgi:hypothetical protein